MSEEKGERFERGWETVAKINGPARDQQFHNLGEIAPDFARWIVESVYADILSRPQLPLRDREIATVAALTALGNAPAQLEAHIVGALNVGVGRQEIVEVIAQMAVYAGVPAAIKGLAITKQVFAARDIPEER
ncbi:MAG TPA: carboxymuconolactone decarboxylase family protein [Caulobacteraceae bacterium]